VDTITLACQIKTALIHKSSNGENGLTLFPIFKQADALGERLTGFFLEIISGYAHRRDENTQSPRRIATCVISDSRIKALGKVLVDFVVEIRNRAQALVLAIVRRFYPCPL
jgi:hypothetical protein